MDTLVPSNNMNSQIYNHYSTVDPILADDYSFLQVTLFNISSPLSISGDVLTMYVSFEYLAGASICFIAPLPPCSAAIGGHCIVSVPYCEIDPFDPLYISISTPLQNDSQIINYSILVQLISKCSWPYFIT